MTDTIRTLQQLLILMADNITQQISPQDVRDTIVSMYSGYGGYEDLATKTTRINVTGGVPTTITCDALGANTRETRLPFNLAGPNALWDPVNNRVKLSGLKIDDIVFVRSDFTFRPAQQNTEINHLYAFYDAANNYIFTLDHKQSEIKAIADNTFSVLTNFYIGPAIVGGSIELQLLASHNGTLEVGGVFVTVMR